MSEPMTAGFTAWIWVLGEYDWHIPAEGKLGQREQHLCGTQLTVCVGPDWLQSLEALRFVQGLTHGYHVSHSLAQVSGSTGNQVSVT